MRSLLRFTTMLVVVAVSITAGYLIENSPIVEGVELASYDFRLKLRGPLPPAKNSPVTILAIDEESFGTIKKPLIFWPQEIGKVIRRLSEAGATAIGVDLIFEDLRDVGLDGMGLEDNQQELVAAIVGSASPILMAYRVEGRSVDQLPPQLSMAADGNAAMTQVSGNGRAYVNLTTDRDDFVRRQELYSSAEDGTNADSFAYAIAKAHLKSEQVTFKPLPDNYPGRVDDELSSLERTVMVNFRGLNHFPLISLVDVWKEDFSPEVLAQFKGRIVLIGMVNERDRHATPLYSWADLSVTREMRRTAGVYVHANTIATLLEQEFISRPDDRWQIGILVGLVLLTGIVCYYFVPLKAIPISVATVALFCLASYLLFNAGFWINTVAPILGAFLAMAGTQAANYALEGKDKKALRGLFRRYVHDQVIEQILANPNLSFAGERKRITVMFADIRNFTTRSEGAQPEELVRQLNRYFERMVTAIQHHQGTVDKFMGDGIMAIFGDPLDDSDSALHAVRAGQAMLHSMEQLNSRFEGEGVATMQMGIGLHTGEAIVGNIGSSQRMEYTAIGDVVNTASRVEGLNKKYKTSFLATRDTFNALEGRFHARYIADVLVKGRRRPVPLLEFDWRQQEEPPGTVAEPETQNEAGQLHSLADVDFSAAPEEA